MKTKLIIITSLIMAFSLIIPGVSLRAEEVSSADMPILSKELPSYANLQREKRSIASSEITSVATPYLSAGRAMNQWIDPEMPTEGFGDNNVGAPIGDVSLPIVLLAILIYFIYRSTSTSRRKNNF